MRVVSWRRVDDGWTTRLRSSYIAKVQCDIAFYIKEGRQSSTSTKHPSINIVAIKNDRIDRSNILQTIHTESSWRAKEIIDCVAFLLGCIGEKFDEEQSTAWVKMQLMLADTGVSTSPGHGRMMSAGYHSSGIRSF